MYKRLLFIGENLSNESVTSVTTLLVQILSIEEKTCGASCLPCLHFYLHPSFTILHFTFFSIYIIIYFGPKYKAQNFLTTLYNFYKAEKKKKTLQYLQ